MSQKGPLLIQIKRMFEMTANLKIDLTEIDVLILCLALGTIEAMRSGSLPLESGIWTLGRPKFWKPLKKLGWSSEVIKVFQTADELEAIGTFCGQGEIDQRLTEMADILRKHLHSTSNKFWDLDLSDLTKS